MTQISQSGGGFAAAIRRAQSDQDAAATAFPKLLTKQLSEQVRSKLDEAAAELVRGGAEYAFGSNNPKPFLVATIAPITQVSNTNENVKYSEMGLRWFSERTSPRQGESKVVEKFQSFYDNKYGMVGPTVESKEFAQAFDTAVNNVIRELGKDFGDLIINVKTSPARLSKDSMGYFSPYIWKWDPPEAKIEFTRRSDSGVK